MNPDQNRNEGGSEIPNGSAAAAILSAGVGCFCVSLFDLLGDAFPALGHFFNFYNPTGPLSGVTTSAILVWLALWAVLSRAWKIKTLPLGKINIATFLLIIAGLLLRFPPFGDWLQGR
jgi:hypothetical protein